jgi:exodeoxyribonuclease V alpha subunit
MAADQIVFDCGVVEIAHKKPVEAGDWAILKVRVKNRLATPLPGLPGIFNLVGLIPTSLTIGDKINCSGAIHLGDRFGPEFKATEIQLVMPKTAAAVRDSMANIPGIGRVIADRAVSAYHGEADIIGAMLKYPARLNATVDTHSANLITRELRVKWSMHEAEAFLFSLGLRKSDIVTTCRALPGVDVKAAITANPFVVASVIGFKKCDMLSKELGFSSAAPERLDAGTIHLAEEECRERGHCAVPIDTLTSTVADKLQVYEDDIKNTIARLSTAGKLIEATLLGRDEVSDFLLGQHLIYPERFWRAEQDVIDRMSCVMATSMRELEIKMSQPDKPDWVASPDQKDAMEKIARSKISVLTGLPGSGKTTIIKLILDSALEADMKVVLCAPTGLAARRMKDACKYESITIHRALGIREGTHLGNADLVIVDEMSMVGIELFRDLMLRVQDSVMIILVGDPDQLPSIDPGNVLSDIIDSSVVPVCRLVKIHRQGEGSLICENIARIHRGEMPVMVPGNSEFHMAFCDDPCEIIKATVGIAGILAEKSEHRAFDVQVIVPTNNGLLGADGLNRELRKKLNAPNIPVDPSGYAKYTSNDKVIQTTNDYERGVVNGEIGRVLYATDDAVMVQFDGVSGRRVNYSSYELNQLKHAYCVTCHKSQGSEFPSVINVLADLHGRMLTRRLVYTSFARGRKKVVFIGQKSALLRALANTHCDIRYTGLSAGLAAKLAC